MVDIGSRQEFMDTLLEQPTVTQADFLSLLKLLGVTTDVVIAANLLKAIRLFDSSDAAPDCIHSNLCKRFADLWVDRASKQKLNVLLPGEEVLKVLPLARVSDKGTGTLVLTQQRLLFTPNHQTTTLELTKLKNVQRLDKSLHRSVLSSTQALTLICSTEISAPPATSKVKKGADDPTTSIVSLVLFNDFDDWFLYLTELKNAHKLATLSADPNLVSKAARNILLVETVARVRVFLTQ